REWQPQCPRTYGVAVLGDVNKRRWFPMDSVLTVDRLRLMFEDAAAAVDRRTAGRMVAARLAHEILGRMLPLVLVEGRAWDAGLENLWVHFDADNDIDWVAVVDPTLRVLPDDPCVPEQGKRSHVVERLNGDTLVVLPSESALTTWVAHRCHRTLTPLFTWLYTVSAAAVSVAAMWQIVGSAVVAAASQLPYTAEGAQFISWRRSQAILDAMAGFGCQLDCDCSWVTRLS
ncbi:iron reductase, partial [Mycobacterium montefiorense]|uniref:iron reductase n=1 Tax=Mycobacterium montefiorense TaxID=154654 RepID=UPI0022326E30